MTLRAGLAALIVAVVALIVWRSQLFVVSRPGVAPRALQVMEPSARRPVSLDVTLPAIPIGATRLRSREGVLLVHYWAPWEHRALAQATALDSLRRLESLTALRVEVVCFDPFPSVTRYIARQRLRLEVLLDRDRQLARVLPCPSLPYTWVLDRQGRVAIEQAGEVDWLARGTHEALGRLLAEPEADATADTAAAI